MPNENINLNHITEIRRMRDKLSKIAKELETHTPEFNKYDIQNEELAKLPLSSLTIRKAVKLDDRQGPGDEIPGELEDIADTPLNELNLSDLTHAVKKLKESGSIDPEAQTFIACGGSGCIVYSN